MRKLPGVFLEKWEILGREREVVKLRLRELADESRAV